MKKNVVISMCDKSGIMVEPWATAGCICICVDVQHGIRATRTNKHSIKKINNENGGEIHYVYGDARSWKPSQFDIYFHEKYKIIFVACFPVCTNVAGSGAQDWLLKGLAMLTDGLMLFNSCEQIADWSGAPYCIENPVGCISSHHRSADHYFHPWHWGDLYSKKTCLWTGNGFIMPDPKYYAPPWNNTNYMAYVSPRRKTKQT